MDSPKLPRAFDTAFKNSTDRDENVNANQDGINVKSGSADFDCIKGSTLKKGGEEYSPTIPHSRKSIGRDSGEPEERMQSLNDQARTQERRVPLSVGEISQRNHSQGKEDEAGQVSSRRQSIYSYAKGRKSKASNLLEDGGGIAEKRDAHDIHEVTIGTQRRSKESAVRDDNS